MELETRNMKSVLGSKLLILSYFPFLQLSLTCCQTVIGLGKNHPDPGSSSALKRQDRHSDILIQRSKIMGSLKIMMYICTFLFGPMNSSQNKDHQTLPVEVHVVWLSIPRLQIQNINCFKTLKPLRFWIFRIGILNLHKYFQVWKNPKLSKLLAQSILDKGQPTVSLSPVCFGLVL